MRAGWAPGRVGRLAATGRRLAPALWAAPLALVLSCADMPNSPKALVRIEGTILDKSGQGMFAVAVYFENPEVEFNPYTGDPSNLPPGELPQYRAVTHADGTYDLWLPEGNYRIVAVPLESSGYAPAVVAPVHLDEERRRWNYRYAWPTVTIRTIEAGGGSIPNSRAVLMPRIDYGDPYVFYYSVAARRVGDVLEAVLAPGNYRLIVDPGGSGSGYIESQYDLAVTGDTTITVTGDGYTVSARVTGHAGAAMAGAYVSTYDGQQGASAVTDPSGIAVFHLPAGSYSWYVNPPASYISGREFTNVSISGDATLDLAMGGTEWTGTVRRAGDGAPLGNVIVRASESRFSAHMPTDAAGNFRLIVRTGVGHRIRVLDMTDYREILTLPNVYAGADSTFDLVVDVPVP